MQMIIVLAAVVALALAAPQQAKDVQITRYENDNIGVGNYNYAFETSDGQSASEQGELKNAGSENEVLAVRGSYSYVGPDGVTYTVNYIADENGFQPQGAHIPQPQ